MADRIRLFCLIEEPTLLEAIQTAIDRQSDQFDLETATDPDGGVARLSSTPVDCLVCGGQFRGGSWTDVLETVRETHPALPIVFVVDQADDVGAPDALTAGATDVLSWSPETDLDVVLTARLRNAISAHGIGATDVDHQAPVVEEAPIGIVLIDRSLPSNPIVSVNDEFERQTGYDRTELSGQSLSILEGRATDPSEATVLSEALEAGESVSVELQLSRRDGLSYWSQFWLVPLEGNSAIGFQQDVTIEKRRERELERERMFNEQALDTLDDLFYVVDVDGTLRRWNDRLEAVTGYDRESISNMGVTDFFVEDHRELIADSIQTVFDGEQLTVEADLRTASGLRIPYELTGARLVGPDGTLTGLVGIGRDLTDRKKRERERAAAVEFLGGIYEVTTDLERAFEEKIDRLLELGSAKIGLPYGFLTEIDTDDGIQRIVAATGDHELLQPGQSCSLTEAYCQQTIESDSLFAMTDALEAGLGEDAAYETFGLDSYVGIPVTVEGKLYGTLCFAATESRSEPFGDIDRMFVRLMGKWASYELERERANDALREQNERLEAFASVVSHDLRNPLNVAEGHLEIERDERDSEHLSEVADSLARMGTLIDDLLTLARQGESLEDRQPVALEAVAMECWGNVATENATIVVDAERAILADRSRLVQLLENLYRNALDHVGEDVTVTVGLLEGGFGIEDDGPGIPADDREEIFETGYTTSNDGTGFGLSIVAEIVDAHGWEIEVTEGTDGGARFEITGVEEPS